MNTPKPIFAQREQLTDISSLETIFVKSHWLFWMTSSGQQHVIGNCRSPVPLLRKRTDVLTQYFAKSRYLGLIFSNRSEIWQAPRQQRCQDAWKITERYHYNKQPHGLETSRELAVRRLIVFRLETQWIVERILPNFVVRAVLAESLKCWNIGRYNVDLLTVI